MWTAGHAQLPVLQTGALLPGACMLLPPIVRRPRGDASRSGRLEQRRRRRSTPAVIWPLRLGVALGMVVVAAALCGDSIPEVDEECDDGNVIDNDGCSGQCKTESLAYMTWYASANCTGKIYKQLIFNDREYVRSKDAVYGWRTGRCLSGIDCKCYSEFPFCSDGTDTLACMCMPPSCGDIINFYDRTTSLPKCNEWTLGVKSNKKYSYTVTCRPEWTRMTTITDESVAGAFILTKHWKLTFSTAASMQQVGDSYAWENTRARATGHSAADLWVAVAPKTCIPSFSNLLPEDRENRELSQWEYHDPVTQRVKMGCHDDSCANCTMDLPMAQATCNRSVTCQVLSPGRCFACSGGLSAQPLEGFQVWPGPPAPEPYRCVPCSQAPTNYFYANTDCKIGQGCGGCGQDLPAWPVVFWPGSACGACAQKDAPATACGDQREGGLPYFWVNAKQDLSEGALQHATEEDM